MSTKAMRKREMNKISEEELRDECRHSLLRNEHAESSALKTFVSAFDSCGRVDTASVHALPGVETDIPGGGVSFVYFEGKSCALGRQRLSAGHESDAQKTFLAQWAQGLICKHSDKGLFSRVSIELQSRNPRTRAQQHFMDDAINHRLCATFLLTRDTPLSQPFIIAALCQGAAMFSFAFLVADEDGIPEAEANIAKVRGKVPFGAKVKRKRAIT
ncbi:uncharacterized protein PAC_06881 [Phialocephala subalpina]|uniref:Uncharacterized protein n=1 Tax=Phialocephala subalpina TaxID=576137 RepID=A0A1L7WW55_9HELO|nr:uncharacterized protein PAC_06881 [Phialocephala subalpina]